MDQDNFAEVNKLTGNKFDMTDIRKALEQTQQDVDEAIQVLLAQGRQELFTKEIVKKATSRSLNG